MEALDVVEKSPDRPPVEDDMEKGTLDVELLGVTVMEISTVEVSVV